MIIRSKLVEVVRLGMCRVFVSTSGHPLDKTVRDANLFCWLRHLERVSFFVSQKAILMAEKNEEIDIPWYQKVITIGIVVLVAVIIFMIIGAISEKPS